MGTTGLLPGVSYPLGPSEFSTKSISVVVEGSSDQDDAKDHMDDDLTSTMSESSSGISGLDRLVSSKTTERQTSGRKALHGHESDVDSGIVSCQLMDNHTASISSSETDSSRESTSNEQKSRSISDSTQCVRFDEHLHLSEENIRRSCRKLFATLYSHRYSYPCYNDCGILSKSCEKGVPPSEVVGKCDGSGQVFPHSRLGVTKLSELLEDSGSRRYHYKADNDSVCKTFGTNTNRGKDFAACKNVQKFKPEYRSSVNNVVHSSPKFASDIMQRNSEKTDPMLYSTRYSVKSSMDQSNHRTNYASLTKEQSNYRNLTADRRLELVSSKRFETQKQPYQPMPYQNGFTKNPQNGKPMIHKSLSCTVLPASENCLSLPCEKFGPTYPRRTSDPISISSLNISDGYHDYGVETSLHRIPQATTRHSMVRAYARVVPVVSDDANSCASSKTEAKTAKDSPKSFNGARDQNHVAYPVSPVALSTHSKDTKIKSNGMENRATENGIRQGHEIMPARKSSSYKDMSYCKSSDEIKGSTRFQKGRSYWNGRNSDVTRSHPNFSEIKNREYASHRSPSNETVAVSSHGNVSPYKSFTLNHLRANGNRKSRRTEYEVLDKSQKNRFNSLPVLDNLVSGDIKDGSLPTNSKRGLHLSDFTLYRNRTSPSASSSGKSFLDRIQGFTRSAKNAVQKAFSTERIYRPEREERYEAEGQKLKRSRSFIRGLKERMSKKKRREAKKKKKKPPAAQVVTQERLNTSWNEPVLGPGAVTHVEGQLLQLNPDGSQVIELTKPPSKPYGFFVARGRIRNSRGIFVSRMRDQETEEHLTGLLGIGDEILEIEGLNVKHADILEVNSLMSQRNSLILTVLPYVCRKD